MRIYSFPPIIGDNPKILILGSMPSVKSLEKGEYYGFGPNQFWRILGDVYGFNRDDPYNMRVEIIKNEGIALWDVIESCEREKSLDQNITKEIYNDITGLLKAYPTIQRILLNGGKAYEDFRKTVDTAQENWEVIKLYSTSPASTIPYIKKLEAWTRALKSQF